MFTPTVNFIRPSVVYVPTVYPATVYERTTAVSLAPRAGEPLVPCTDCSMCGFYLDYAGPGVAGGFRRECKGCGGRGWRPHRP